MKVPVEEYRNDTMKLKADSSAQQRQQVYWCMLIVLQHHTEKQAWLHDATPCSTLSRLDIQHQRLIAGS